MRRVAVSLVTAAVITVLAAQIPATASTRPKSPPPSRADEASGCAEEVRSKSATIAPSCWRVGPLTLGMETADVARILGAPDFQGQDAQDYTQTLYVFPRNLAAMLAAEPSTHPAYRLLALKFSAGQLVEISNNPSQTLTGSPCRAQSRTPAKNGPPPGFSRFQGFAGVRVGDKIEALTKRFGSPTRNASGDFFSYWPIPLTFDALDGRRVSGFSIAANAEVMSVGSSAHIFFSTDPSSCRVTGLKFLASDGAL